MLEPKSLLCILMNVFQYTYLMSESLRDVDTMKPHIAIIIPAYNEERTIGEVVRAFAERNMAFTFCVIDNNSSDKTGAIAAETIAECGVDGRVLFEPRQGKAIAVRRAFSTIDADVYVLVDADMTYPADAVEGLIEPVISGRVDMVVGDRISGGSYSKENKRAFHEGGNKLVRWMVNRLYRSQLRDILSGYRVFSRRFVKTYPVLCDGFELEADLTLHALDKKIPFEEIPIQYKDRPEGSSSKLNTLQDGVRIVKLMLNIFRHYRPLLFFGSVSLLFFVLSLVCGIAPVLDYIRYQFVYHVPLAVLAAALGILSIIFLSIALVLDSIASHHRFDYELRLISFRGD